MLVIICTFQIVGVTLDDDGSGVETDSIMSVEPTCRVIHKDHDNTISAICLNSVSLPIT